ncbi:hypothetical protein GCM10020367_61550 [Streptomyces sannanensis]|uniref:Uncharacterized protein n=1 Tax=Streptomyces sannanensis TaxID=285536 RepID=A0ABP6SKQ7_9ACTN
MTRPTQAAPASGSDDALFGPEAADYARYRPGLPDAAVRLLATTQHGVPDPSGVIGRESRSAQQRGAALSAPLMSRWTGFVQIAQAFDTGEIPAHPIPRTARWRYGTKPVPPPLEAFCRPSGTARRHPRALISCSGPGGARCGPC